MVYGSLDNFIASPQRSFGLLRRVFGQDGVVSQRGRGVPKVLDPPRVISVLSSFSLTTTLVTSFTTTVAESRDVSASSKSAASNRVSAFIDSVLPIAMALATPPPTITSCSFISDSFSTTSVSS